MKLFIKTIALVSILFLISAKVQTPVLKIGKAIDYKNQTMLGSATFSKKDKKFVYFLYNHTKFGVSTLTLRFYKVLENGNRTLESINVNVDPESNVISDSLDLIAFYKEFGKGKFLMQFLQGDTEVASGAFTLQ